MTATEMLETDSSARTERLVAGWGAIGFASLVLAVNVFSSGMPSMDASAAEVTEYLADHRTLSAISAGAFALSAVMIASFACAIYGRLRAVCRPADMLWARIGTLGAVLLFPMFGAVVASRLVLTVGIDEAIGSPDFVLLLWRLENAAFLLNMIAIALAIFGLGTAATRAGLIPRWYRFIAPVAAACAVIAPAFAVASLEGSPVGLLGFVAFLSWMLLLYLIGFGQLTRRGTSSAPMPAL